MLPGKQVLSNKSDLQFFWLEKEFLLIIKQRFHAKWTKLSKQIMLSSWEPARIPCWGSTDTASSFSCSVAEGGLEARTGICTPAEQSRHRDSTCHRPKNPQGPANSIASRLSRELLWESLVQHQHGRRLTQVYLKCSLGKTKSKSMSWSAASEHFVLGNVLVGILDQFLKYIMKLEKDYKNIFKGKKSRKDALIC